MRHKGENLIKQRRIRLKRQNFTEKPTSKLKKRHEKKTNKTWNGEQCQDIEENLQKNNSKKAYQLVKELTSSKQEELLSSRTKQQDILKRWTKHCYKLYTHNNNRSQGAKCPSTNHDSYPILREEVEATAKSLKKG